MIGVSERWLVYVLKTTRRREDEVVFLASVSTPRLKMTIVIASGRNRYHEVYSQIFHSNCSCVKYSMFKYNQYAASVIADD